MTQSNGNGRRVLVTGTAGFIGYHTALRLLREGFRVHGYDGLTDYYDVRLKERRHAMLMQHEGFSATVGMLEDAALLARTAETFAPEIIIHLAAQAGVRYSLENPRAYVDSNVVGSFNVLECARSLRVSHLLIASTSSVYGANETMPYLETDKADTQLTIYAATKKACEAMAHSYAHLWGLPTTMFRFFTVYGPWGRPDMAPSKFLGAMLEGRAIDIYNNGEMYRDFTYVDDLVEGIRLLIDAPPEAPGARTLSLEGDSLSPAAPFRVVNIGNSKMVRLLDFIEAMEEAAGCKAVRNYMEFQPGEVRATWADNSLLRRLTGFCPQTDYRQGVERFVAWFRDYHAR